MKENVLKIMKELEEINCNYDYKTMELAICLWLRSDIYEVKESLNETNIHRIQQEIEDLESVLNYDVRNSIDKQLYKECDN